MMKPITFLLVPLALVTFVAACGDDDDTTDTAADDTTETTAAMDDEAATAGSPEGPACSTLPSDGEGSLSGMADDPVATAASNNPALSTLVTAVSEGELVDTLNTGGPFTVFAPVNDAFAAIPADTMDAVMADRDTLTSILTYHVVAERIEPEDLGGTYTTVNGAELEVSGDGPEFTVGDASVVCAGIQTDNATVYLIDAVLMPPMAG
jgi:uncharacterized surface protein with fasciclin (FAS1) repeats